MTRFLSLAVLALFASTAAAQSDVPAVRGLQAEMLADSIFQEVLDAESARFDGVESMVLYGSQGTIYYRVEEDGTIDCRAALQPGIGAGFGDALCFMTLLREMRDEAEGAEEDFAISVSQQSLAGRAVHVIGMLAEGKADDFEEMTAWVDASTSALVRIQVRGEILPGQTMTMTMDRGDFRNASGVIVPHSLRLEIPDFADTMLAEIGMSGDDLMAEAQRRAAIEGTPEAASMLAMIKSIVAKGSLVVEFRVTSVEVNGPLPEGVIRQPRRGEGPRDK